MKTVIFSDSHGDIATMRKTIRLEKPNAVIHLGDHIGDARELQITFPEITLYAVPGNNDRYDSGKIIDVIEIDDKRIMLTHGHTFNLEDEKGLRDMLSYGTIQKVRVIMFGHTHQAFIRHYYGVWLINPGSVRKQPNGMATYALMTVTDGKIQWNINEV